MMFMAGHEQLADRLQVVRVRRPPVVAVGSASADPRGAEAANQLLWPRTEVVVSVFLVTIRADGNSWRRLAAEPIYYGKVMISGSRPGDDAFLFEAAAHEDRCRIESSRASALRGGVKKLDLGHGETFDLEGTTYLVYVQQDDAEWSEAAPAPLPPASADALERLRLLPPAELAAAASRFLTLPHVLAWWEREFVARTGFVQCRDGRVPAVRSCKLTLQDGGAQLAWDVQIWSPIGKTWTGAKERASFARSVSADDLLLLRDCATRLSVLGAATGAGPTRAPLLRKVGWATVALSLLLAFTLLPICFALGSQELVITTSLFRAGLLGGKLAMPTSFSADGHVDPWGHPWRFRPRSTEPSNDPETWRWGFYSVGPDGKDDVGLGDDAWGHELHFSHPECRFLAVSREGFLLLAFTLTWLLAHPWQGVARSPSKGREAARALVIAAPPTLVVFAMIAWLLTWVAGDVGKLARSTSKLIMAPLPLAVSLSIYLLLFVVVFAFRMRAPLAPDPD
jgi:hypothetical protein